MSKIKTRLVRYSTPLIKSLKASDKGKVRRLTAENFYKVLMSSNLGLTPVEMETTLAVYGDPDCPEYIDYMKFIEILQEAYSAPCLAHPAPEFLCRTGDRNFMNFEERHMLSVAMQKFSKMPYMEEKLLPLFHSYDKEKCGTVTEHHFTRVLTLAGMASMVSSHEMEIVFKNFNFTKGKRNEVDYQSFVRMIEVLYGKEKFNPFQV